jgi:hypothetical protein
MENKVKNCNKLYAAFLFLLTAGLVSAQTVPLGNAQVPWMVPVMTKVG